MSTAKRVSGGWRRRLAWPLRRLAQGLYPRMEELRREGERQRVRDLLSYFQSCGQGVKCAGRLKVTDPRNVVCGAQVEFEDNIFLQTEGGVAIGDRAVLGRNCVVETIAPPDAASEGKPDGFCRVLPVLIGRDVTIGNNVTIHPGAIIGDGAKILSGAVVRGEVPSDAVVVPAAGTCIRLTGNRSGKTLARGEVSAASRLVTADDPAARIFFVVGTGRCGSLTISRVLSQHPDATCRHEPRPQMIRLAAEWAHRERDREQIRRELDAVFRGSSVFPANKVYGESDQNYSHLIPLLADLLPASRFIWLIRDGRDFVASASERGWYSSQADAGNPVSHELMDRWLYYRLNGSRCGELSHEEWDALPLFERYSWYWRHVNRVIEASLQNLPPDRWRRLKIEEFAAKTDEVLRFLGLRPSPLVVRQHNKANYEITRWEEWSVAEHEGFERWCGAEMDRWYAGWKAPDGVWQRHPVP